MMLSRRLGVVLAAIVAGLALSGFFGTVWGAEYPTKNINFIIPYAPGGTVDPISRLLAQVSEPILKGKFVMVNKSGAGATLGTAEIVQAKPDGYTIGMTESNAVGLSPQLKKLPYYSPEDYQPIIMAFRATSVLIVRTDAPWKTLAEFTAEAKKRPGQIKVGLNGALVPGEIAITYYSQLVGIQLNLVPFSGGGGENMANLLGGHIHASVTTPGSSQANVAAGKVRVLATVPGDRNPLFPDVPSMKELGFDFPMPANLYFVIGPKGLDRAIVDKLYKVFAEAVKTPAIQQFATKNGLIIGVAGPEETAKQIRDMWQLYAKVIKDFKLEVQR